MNAVDRHHTLLTGWSLTSSKASALSFAALSFKKVKRLLAVVAPLAYYSPIEKQ